jgi:hypothetical protein
LGDFLCLNSSSFASYKVCLEVIAWIKMCHIIFVWFTFPIKGIFPRSKDKWIRCKNDVVLVAHKNIIITGVFKIQDRDNIYEIMQEYRANGCYISSCILNDCYP